ncbi:N-6 DNA methylase [Streptomyces edwardsiae]|uniref:site-specific DNA-methyltransferase (adenine-specific) n=1 Tax=Streptomyces edwardsiae TaxID=3075527 RepID=A0ABU2PPZ5_9ACTN|nr:N-6 DNA methylase [Streptomyces sp. DSM 41636]MDT0394228.1 N-6 DNA methylase [Streptomyces sp. DSM 41636]
MSTEQLPNDLREVLARLAVRNAMRTEATLQADVRQLLLSGDFNLGDQDLSVDLETQVGDGRRIDVEVGCTVIEVKKDLRGAAVLTAATKQLAGYVAERVQQTGQQYVGILTDGVDWRAYHLRDQALSEVAKFTHKATRGLDLLFWLEGVLATQTHITPTPPEIRKRLGADSSSHQLDKAALAALYDEYGELPTVKFKRGLWARLLRTAFGAQFHDKDELFIEHTLLVNSAEIIAHLVMDVDVTTLQPATILLGHRFDRARLYGVVESDFFDWVIEVPGGESFVKALSRRLSRFDWSDVEHDVLKVLYESIISTDTRRKLGEYYTPDWLAERVVSENVIDPLNQRVLDPSCGSGTFLFHAARRYLHAADSAGMSLREALRGLTDHVVGIDLHPVAVALARVTYLLAIGRERLLGDRGTIHVPVYLGDSVQWQQRVDLLSEGHLTIKTGTAGQVYENELRFPEELLAGARSFDDLVNSLADAASNPNRPMHSVPSLTPLLNRLAIPERYRPQIVENFRILCALVDNNENHIWSYYIRNQARPMWLSRAENRANVLVGNPPWVSYRKMSQDLQSTFKEMSQDRGLWQGGKVASHQDLSSLFIARAVQQYLTEGGTFAFVVPNAVLDRPYFSGFREGRYEDPGEPVTVAFTGSWDLRRLRPHFFPRGSGVVMGRRNGSDSPVPLPRATERWTGSIPPGLNTWSAVSEHISRTPAELAIAGEGLIDSPYRSKFENGATIYPRKLFFVDTPEGEDSLGLGGGRTAVRSSPVTMGQDGYWKQHAPLEGVVETEFIQQVMLSECVLPYRLLPPRKAVLPLEGRTILHGEHPHMDRYPDLADWWRGAEAAWEARPQATAMTLVERLNFFKGLTNQLPGTTLRVVYVKSGTYVSAALIESPDLIIETSLYWGTVHSREEGMYLCAILNTPALTELVRPLMSYGKDERHVDKYVWELPIPLFDSQNPVHARLAELGSAEAERVAAMELDESKAFTRLRPLVRKELSLSPHAMELDLIVSELLD